MKDSPAARGNIMKVQHLVDVVVKGSHELASNTCSLKRDLSTVQKESVVVSVLVWGAL